MGEETHSNSVSSTPIIPLKVLGITLKCIPCDGGLLGGSGVALTSFRIPGAKERQALAVTSTTIGATEAGMVAMEAV